ncbi:MAG: hypothetical protein J1E62_04035 [Lachnospiraceae bacterium]|nr:hypothetical protein [Lachnospiraceae bacterium]
MARNVEKYKFTGETKQIHGGVTLKRICAVRGFGKVNSGDLGGWIEEERNLSHEGEAWVAGNAMVYDNASVYGDAIVCDSAKVYGNAKVYDTAAIDGSTWVADDAQVYGDAYVSDSAFIGCEARIYGNAKVCNFAYVSGSAQVYGDVFIESGVEISGNACVHGEVGIPAGACIADHADVSSRRHIFVINDIVGEFPGDCITFFRNEEGEIIVEFGTFDYTGNITGFLDKVGQEYGETKRALFYRKAVEMAELWIE